MRLIFVVLSCRGIVGGSDGVGKQRKSLATTAFEPGDDVCLRIRDVCDSAKCEEAMRRNVTKQLEATTEQWTFATQKLFLRDSYFCGCCEGDFGDEHTGTSKAMLALLREAIKGRSEPLQEYNRRRLLLESPLARARHYGDASRYLPRNAFIADALALALKAAGKLREANGVLRKGVDAELWPSVDQRPAKYTPLLRSQPFWDLEIPKVADTAKTELVMALVAKKELLTPQAEGLVENNGIWEELVLRKHGVSFHEDLFPETHAALNGTFFNVKFSILHPGTSVAPHCGPSNARLRAHLTLAHTGGAFLTVANESRSWSTPGTVIVFDDSFEHSVRNTGSRPRIVLILDFWHPDLPLHQRNFAQYGVIA